MASAASGDGPSAGGSETREIRLKLMKPGAREPQNLSIDVNLSLTVRELRSQIQEAAPEHPDASSLRLIYQGRQLADDTVLRDAFRAGLDSTNPIHLHVVIRPNPITPTSTTIPARGYFSSSSSSNTTRSATSSRATGQSPTPTTPQNRVPGSNTPRSHGVSPAAALLAQGRVHGNAQVISYNRQVTITTTGTIIRSGGARTRNTRTGGDGGESSESPLAAMDQAMDGTDLASGSQSTPQASGTSQTPARSESGPRPGIGGPSSILRSLLSNATRTNSGSQRIIHTQTHTFRFTTQAQPSSSNSGAEPANQDQTPASFYRHINPILTPNPPPASLGPFAEEYYGDLGTPIMDPNPPQYYLLQGPHGPASILLSPTPPAPAVNTWGNGLPPRMRSPLAPIGSHMAPPPGLNLNENLGVETATAEPLQQFGQQVRNENDAIGLDELERRREELLRLVEQEPLQNFYVPQPQPPARQPGVLDYFVNLLVWFFGGNLVIPNEQRMQVALNWLVTNTWLAIRLALGVYILGGGRDARRDMILWAAAAIIFFVQSGLFGAYLQPYIHRLNALVPDANRLVARHEQAQNQNQREPGVPDPQELADRLIRQHNRPNGIWDNIQTSVSIFVASLVPGLGERVGNARALQDRLEREAIERAAQAAEGIQNEDGGAGNVEEGDEQPNPPNPNPNDDRDVQAMFGL